MKKRPDDRPGPTWFQTAELARLLAITRDQFDRSYKDLVPESAKRKKGLIIWIKGRSLIDAIVRRDVDKLVSKDPDPMMAGPVDGSPSLERYRRIQADRAELKLGNV